MRDAATGGANTHDAPSPDEHAGLENTLPAWLCAHEDYEPLRDRDAYLTRSLLSMTSVLARFRLDTGTSGPLSPSAPVKLVSCLALLVMLSLSRNYFFVLCMLAMVLVCACLLPRDALVRVATTACGAAALSALIMLPATLLGQAHSLVLVSTKVLVSVGLVLCTTLSATPGQLTGGLRALHVPSLVILTVELALKGIVSLGSTALESLTALRLRSVGRNDRKASSVGGVGGVVLLKASRATEQTYEAMRCRGFEGDYPLPARHGLRGADLLWLAILAMVFALFLYLQKAV